MSEVQTIEIGDLVYAFEFENLTHIHGERAGYVTGTTIGRDGCPRYEIVSRIRCEDGQEQIGCEIPENWRFIASVVNGTPKMFGGETNFVRRCYDQGLPHKATGEHLRQLQQEYQDFKDRMLATLDAVKQAQKRRAKNV